MQADDTTADGASEGSTGGQICALEYEIRIKGYLDARWSAWFDGLNLTKGSDGTTVIYGPVVDQAALHGLLQKLRDVGLPLVSIAQVDPRRDAPTMEPRDLQDHKESDMATDAATAAKNVKEAR